jgi:hypothetical protein
MLNRIFDPKTEEVTGGLKKLHGGDLHNLYPSTNWNIIQMEKIGKDGVDGKH